MRGDVLAVRDQVAGRGAQVNDRQRRLIHGVLLVTGVIAMTVYEVARMRAEERRRVVGELWASWKGGE